jgi:hypothetical protein
MIISAACLSRALLARSFAGVLFLIVDLDRAHEGLPGQSAGDARFASGDEATTTVGTGSLTIPRMAVFGSLHRGASCNFSPFIACLGNVVRKKQMSDNQDAHRSAATV